MPVIIYNEIREQNYKFKKSVMSHSYTNEYNFGLFRNNFSTFFLMWNNINLL
jgi:hypothetical protein